MFDLEGALRRVIEIEGSDLHLKVPSVPLIRRLGHLEPIPDTDDLRPEDTEGALRRVLRQDPDVILVGEMRDEETVSTALSAAETGHLVLSTLHTVDAPETINRIIDFFPPHMNQQIRAMLAGTMKSVISQRLVKRADGEGRVACGEVLRRAGRARHGIMNPE